MKEKILSIIKSAIDGGAGADGAATANMPIDITVPDEASFGHYSTNVAMRLAHARGQKPMELANELARAIATKAPAGFFENVEAVAPGFINIWLSKEAVRGEFEKIAGDETYGADESMKGKIVMIEFTDVNPFKQVHAGHLMSNAIGESIARLYESAGAHTVRVNYQSDVGLHVAMGIWAMMVVLQNEMPDEASSLSDKMAYLGRAYAIGSKAHRGEDEAHPNAKEAIEAINARVYSREDQQINALYDAGRAWSLDYFETLYARLGTKFEHYFFESEVAAAGLAIVAAHPDVFEKSEGATVFHGEKYGLHTRVFVNAKGLPVYEAKELGLNQKKFELYPLDASLIITGSEIVDYFKVLLKAMGLTLPEVAAKTKHVPHGMLRLPTGKMSSRTGDVITAESLLDQINVVLRKHVSEKSDMDEKEREVVTEAIAVGAIKYSILKQNPGQDIIFDFEKSLSFEGDAGPYVQYAYARLRNILRKSGVADSDIKHADLAHLDSEVELALMRKVFEFPDVVVHARERYASSALVAYSYKLASAANKFYETTPILKDADANNSEARRNARLALVAIAARTLKDGLALLGIKALEKI